MAVSIMTHGISIEFPYAECLSHFSIVKKCLIIIIMLSIVAPKWSHDMLRANVTIKSNSLLIIFTFEASNINLFTALIDCVSNLNPSPTF